MGQPQLFPPPQGLVAFSLEPDDLCSGRRDEQRLRRWCVSHPIMVPQRWPAAGGGGTSTGRRPTTIIWCNGWPPLLPSRFVSQSGSQAAAFFREVARHQVVWWVRDDQGSPAPEVSTGVRAMPFWSSPVRAQRAAEIWGGGLRPESMTPGGLGLHGGRGDESLGIDQVRARSAWSVMCGIARNLSSSAVEPMVERRSASFAYS
ncbi:DUF2750 domain-containing protein [Actinoplanes sichuanensis]|uniref:DUF2750 domain-containing protein n=1 Tax=Actinoplanes sichuanensis TaxID=512349 RepID=A0ABW4AT89_9ACTN